MPLALFAALCLVAAELGQLIVVPGGSVTLPAFRPLVGVLVAALILSEPPRWRVLVPTACGGSDRSSAPIDRGLLRSSTTWRRGLPLRNATLSTATLVPSSTTTSPGVRRLRAANVRSTAPRPPDVTEGTSAPLKLEEPSIGTLRYVRREGKPNVGP